MFVIGIRMPTDIAPETGTWELVLPRCAPGYRRQWVQFLPSGYYEVHEFALNGRNVSRFMRWWRDRLDQAARPLGIFAEAGDQVELRVTNPIGAPPYAPAVMPFWVDDRLIPAAAPARTR